MLKKLWLKVGVLTFLGFLSWFIYFYRKSGKFRASMMGALLAITGYFSRPVKVEARNADAFVPPHQGRLQKEQHGHFGQRTSTGSSGSDKPDPNDDDSDNNSRNDDDSGKNRIPNNPFPESIEETEYRVQRIREQLQKLEELSDSQQERLDNDNEID